MISNLVLSASVTLTTQGSHVLIPVSYQR